MATITTTNVLSHHAALCPPPLFIQKKSRRATFGRRMLRKSIHLQQTDQCVFGPLDDIIDEIKSNIWRSPLDYSLETREFYWTNPLKAQSTWAVTPLPVSQIPSGQPLTIRKNRHSRSSASDSSMEDAMPYSRNNSQDQCKNGGPAVISSPVETTPWPLYEASTSHEPPLPSSSVDIARSERNSAQQALESVIQNDGSRPEAAKRRSSRLRLFTNSFPRLRRTGTGETSGDSGDVSEGHLPIISSPSIVVCEDVADDDDIEAATDDAIIEAFTRKYARNGNKLASVMGHLARQLPTAMDSHHDQLDDQPDVHALAKSIPIPSTLRAAVRIFPQVKLLTCDYEEFAVAVEVEGVLHNQTPLPDTTIDVIFVVDNGYYVTKECLKKALDAVNGAFYYMNHGDRVALYTTHCTHHMISGNRPDLHYPLRPHGKDTGEIFRDLTASIGQHGTQTCHPPRPNPTMTEVVLSVVKSFKGQNLKNGRTHIILLSPAAYTLHNVSEVFPDIYIHKLNPAILPYRRDPELQDTVCVERCCENVFISNWASYQSVHGRIKRILKHARSQKPVGNITDVCIDLRTRNGCEVIELVGSKDIPYLRLGQVHSLFARVRVTKHETSYVDLDSSDPVFNSSLDVEELRQELLNATIKGATKVHLFDVQVYHRNSLHTTDCWNYTETPFFIIRDLGDLAPPIDTALEVYKRQYFSHFISMTADVAKAEADNILALLDDDNEQAKEVVERMAAEIRYHQHVLEYEKNHRQKLPLCPGPVAIEASPHEWLVDLWDRKKTKRKGVAGVKGEDAGHLIGDSNGREQLG
ncbi:hypothetical protein P153DRAFT_396022 [Dothidotthia symphoricarpi CBS 119687]|uniref:Uncharacterized protein n=1 Tax=Dothidotthia symphoricarpi CBS 119687 TaxID=1392245 RepID=A0A6A6AFS0_9PLEO|nr:uncharacterized protein P153DRAFT_396022 [Dothidotthia symphoricarpi CBS 119687]KAF2130630.1 hypothetical protein P153DRAFT_396022 [Dothidotthia symphoricarpi CBS 119687]